MPDLAGDVSSVWWSNDGLTDSDPYNVTIEAITQQDAIGANLMEFIAADQRPAG